MVVEKIGNSLRGKRAAGTVLRVRAHAGVALFARPPQGSLHFGDRRFLLRRHHAGGCHAHHRHGGDERLPHRTRFQNSGRQRPYDRSVHGFAADRLRRTGRQARIGQGRQNGLSAAGGRGAGIRTHRGQHRRHGARHPAPGPCQSQSGFRQDRKWRHGWFPGWKRRPDRIAHGNVPRRYRGRQDHPGFAGRRRHPAWRQPARQVIPDRRVFEIGMSEYDSSVLYMPLEEAQNISMPRAPRSRSRCSRTIPTGSARLCGRKSRPRRDGRCSSRIGVSATRLFSRRFRWSGT